jgi:hypothetical protein
MSVLTLRFALPAIVILALATLIALAADVQILLT